MKNDVLLKTELPLPLFVKGKVRDTYELGDLLLIIATDRISAFDVVLPNGIPEKGFVLNQLSAFWFKKTAGLVTNHLIQVVDDVSSLDTYLPSRKSRLPAYLAGRSMVVKKVKRINVECVVRGYLAGSAWDEYQQTSTVCGIRLDKGLKQSQELPQAIFTPTTKAEAGHDLPLTLDEMKRLIGGNLAGEIQEKSIAIYNYAREYARTRGIIIADTKMEFGLDEKGKLILIDELLTPDSSRFWEASLYKVGQSQPSYDKQPVRDWLTASGWNKQPPAPELPPEVVASTTKRYKEAYTRLTASI